MREFRAVLDGKVRSADQAREICERGGEITMLLSQETVREIFIREKKSRKLTLDKISAGSGLHKSILSRFQNGVDVNINTLVKIADFFEINLSGNVLKAGGNTLQNIKQAIENDPKLEAEKRVILVNLFESMYNALTKYENNRD
jgi:transcriptional regulator with XRE-family HTH domain